MNKKIYQSLAKFYGIDQEPLAPDNCSITIKADKVKVSMEFMGGEVWSDLFTYKRGKLTLEKTTRPPGSTHEPLFLPMSL